ncbi:MAG: FkbM family methyltransferase [Bacteroidetes bacterium OLB9]|nr:MAG: FkbM family methyltransferase [Bacteroidetes bacterium OLB9]
MHYREEQLLRALKKVELIATTHKFHRMLFHPFKYVFALVYRNIFYKITGKPYTTTTTAFYGKELHIHLPSSTDIYLTSGKAHSSEIKLARFMISILRSGNIFVDVGAHIGYFSGLAAVLVGEEGKVFSFEPTPSTFKLLNNNTKNINQVKTYNYIVSDEQMTKEFYEFPSQYSEYNTTCKESFIHSEWAKKVPYEVHQISSISLDTFFTEEGCIPNLIKIDVEGGEWSVLSGMKHHLSIGSPVVVIEYLVNSNSIYDQCIKFMTSLQYKAYIIRQDGTLFETQDVRGYMTAHQLYLENIVFQKG